VLGLRHFESTLRWHHFAGQIAEMKTGEEKTLVATLPAYLNAPLVRVHIVTINDYLARRDASGWDRCIAS